MLKTILIAAAFGLALTGAANAGALGDLAPLKTIASDTLKIVMTGDLKAAETRVTDLETAWDDAADTMKPKDKVQWRTLDKSLDKLFDTMRAGTPVAADEEAALKAFIATVDAVK